MSNEQKHAMSDDAFNEDAYFNNRQTITRSCLDPGEDEFSLPADTLRSFDRCVIDEEFDASFTGPHKGFDTDTSISFGDLWEQFPSDTQFSSSKSKEFGVNQFQSFEDDGMDLSLFDSNILVDDDFFEDEELDGVPECPFYYDRNSTFCSRADPDEIFTVLEDFLRRKKCDILDFNQGCYKIKGVFYHRCNSTTFAIHVFQVAGSFLVEIQRRSGDSFAFSRFFSQVIEFCGELLSIFPPEGIPPFSSNSYASRVEDSPLSVVSVGDSTLPPLFRMAESTFVETQREAALVLARASSMVVNRPKICTHADFIQTLSKLLSSDDVDVARCGVTCVANLVSEITFVSACVSELLPLLYELLTKFPGHNEVLRQLCLALVIMSSRCGRELSYGNDFRFSLRRISKTTEDDEIKTNSTMILKNIAAFSDSS